MVIGYLQIHSTSCAWMKVIISKHNWHYSKKSVGLRSRRVLKTTNTDLSSVSAASSQTFLGSVILLSLSPHDAVLQSGQNALKSVNPKATACETKTLKAKLQPTQLAACWFISVSHTCGRQPYNVMALRAREVFRKQNNYACAEMLML